MTTPSEMTSPVRTDLPRDLYRGPLRLAAPAYGVSVYVPEGYLAGMFMDELIAIESEFGKTASIYVMALNGTQDEIRQTLSGRVDLGQVQLLATTIPCIGDGKLSAYYDIHGGSSFTRAYACSVNWRRDRALVFIGLSETEVPLTLNRSVQQLADSVQALESAQAVRASASQHSILSTSAPPSYL